MPFFPSAFKVNHSNAPVSTRIRNTQFRFVPDQNGPHQSAFCRTGKKAVTIDRTGRETGGRKNPTEGFSVGLMECISGADSR
jgi:hypothetical protein